jgi:phosphatidyl-myo-inositol dimannoside synthase
MRICIISNGLLARHQFVQPWLHLSQGAHALEQGGHQVFFISDGYPELADEKEFGGFPVKRTNSLQEWPLLGNNQLARFISGESPDLVLWHLGLTSFLRLNTLRAISAPVFGIFTSPIYRPQDLIKLGAFRILRHQGLSLVHILGSFVPSRTIRRHITRGRLKKLLVECETTRARLMEEGVPEENLQVIKPYINPVWFQPRPPSSSGLALREEYGFSSDDFVVGYFGPPEPLRGLTALIQAGKLAIQTNPRVRLLVLSRLLNKTNEQNHARLLKMVEESGMARQVRVISDWLPSERLIQNLSLCNAIALPFELVPSDVPVSVFETMALGIPLITTAVACLPEMVPEGSGLHVPPGDIPRLAEAILRLSNDRPLCQELAWSGREQAQAWTTVHDNQSAWNSLVDEAK